MEEMKKKESERLEDVQETRTAFPEGAVCQLSHRHHGNLER